MAKHCGALQKALPHHSSEATVDRALQEVVRTQIMATCILSCQIRQQLAFPKFLT